MKTMNLKETLKALRKIKEATEDYGLSDMLGDILSVYHDEEFDGDEEEGNDNV